MFTGIIEELGTVVSFLPGTGKDGGARLVLRAAKALAPDDRLKLGESIAVNGVCLTALDINTETFAADLSPETIERTSLRALAPGSRVNLERAMTPSTRFGGHIVQGHVDGVGKLVELQALPDGNWWLAVDIPVELAHYVVSKGSIALNGVSLTVASLTGLDGNRVGLAIIPHTYENTMLHTMKPGDAVNVECDVLAKHVERLLEAQQSANRTRKPRKASSLTVDKLREQGF
ncbi:MAG: riboflavin synthase [Acidobacteria bacterium]|nr:riboflavin synthase [Acidobacteriota bacterium]